MEHGKVVSEISKLTNYNKDMLQFENPIHRVLQESSNITGSFAEELGFSDFYKCNLGKW